MAEFNSPFYQLKGDQLVPKSKDPIAMERMDTYNRENNVHELTRYVEAKLCIVDEFTPITIPPMEDDKLATVPHTSILASKDWESATNLLIICQNQSGSQMGIFSRSLCFDEGLDKGSMLPYVAKARELGYGVLILRPNTNSVIDPNTKAKIPIRGSESPEVHALCVWENIVPLAANLQNISLLGYGNGASLCHEIFLKSCLSQDLNIVNAVVTIEASQLVEQDDPFDIKDHLSKIAVNFEESESSPKGYDLRYRQKKLGCNSMSLGLPEGASAIINVGLSASMALEPVFEFLQYSIGNDLKSNKNLIKSHVSSFAEKFQTNPSKAFTDKNPDIFEQQAEEAELEDEVPPVAEERSMFSRIFGFGNKAAAKEPKKEKDLTVQDFDLLKIVGKGAFGKVLLVRKRQGFKAGNIYAMKVIKKSDVIDKGQIEHTNAEQAILVEIRHPYIVCLRFSFQTIDKLYLITDYYSGGNLFAHLRQAKKFDLERAKFYAAELVLALEHLHDKEIVYRDLKLENILMDHHGHICLTDFGLSKQDMDKSSGALTFCGTAEYIAPELLKGVAYGVEVDWWSYGILIYEMINGRTPFYDKNKKLMYYRIMHNRPQFPSDLFTADAAEIILGLLTVDEKERLGSNGADDIKKMAFFSDVNFDALMSRKVDAPWMPQGNSVTGTEYVLKSFKNMDATRDSSAVSQPAKDPVMQSKMNNAFKKFSFSEENIKDEPPQTKKGPRGSGLTGNGL